MWTENTWYRFKGAQSRLNGLKSLANFSISLFFNPCQSSPSLTILVPLCLVVISLVFFYLCKVLFSGFFQFNSNFIHAQNNSKYRDWAPLRVKPPFWNSSAVLWTGPNLSRIHFIVFILWWRGCLPYSLFNVARNSFQHLYCDGSL